MTTNPSIEQLVYALRSGKARKASAAALVKVFEDNGGMEAFTKPKLSTGMKDLRNLLLGHSQFPIATYYEVVDKTVKFGKGDLYDVASRSEVYQSYPLFKRFWDVNAEEMIQCFHNVTLGHIVNSSTWVNGKWRKKYVTVHEAVCAGDSDVTGGHYACVGKEVFYPDAFLTGAEYLRGEMFRIFDPLVVETIQNHALNCSVRTRAGYARDYLVREDHWALLAADKSRDVVNSLVNNPLLPTDIAIEIALAHKTPYLREKLAKYTASTELLNVIWNSTKSVSIREAVEKNPLFTGPTI